MTLPHVIAGILQTCYSCMLISYISKEKYQKMLCFKCKHLTIFPESSHLPWQERVITLPRYVLAKQSVVPSSAGVLLICSLGVMIFRWLLLVALFDWDWSFPALILDVKRHFMWYWELETWLVNSDHGCCISQCVFLAIVLFVLLLSQLFVCFWLVGLFLISIQGFAVQLWNLEFVLELAL